ncbi:hypothetical protein TorRG33x02_120950 [Trema orientale]|uniref:Uncharacterized protein n=1 Tax=Trema orientale TaxID=63057 RepID=A0A2P5F2K6_TREOI|nr:hypothetical protein TorRG33x02_120950 [Trema orientale]
MASSRCRASGGSLQPISLSDVASPLCRTWWVVEANPFSVIGMGFSPRKLLLFASENPNGVGVFGSRSRLGSGGSKNGLGGGGGYGRGCGGGGDGAGEREEGT